MGRPELPADPRFADDTARAQHIDEVKRITEEWSSRLTTVEALEQARSAGVPAAPARGPRRGDEQRADTSTRPARGVRASGARPYPLPSPACALPHRCDGRAGKGIRHRPGHGAEPGARRAHRGGPRAVALPASGLSRFPVSAGDRQGGLR
ncbi:CoA transferase [Streptomyces sp. NPDC002896]|uniref:CoA transferase n=1 Tax=Streptomyces sp. NPDC002896 TaxID=3154438 RepID=UPI00332AD220